ncbi:hypothetical protein A3224_14280 [Microbulbifer thermotolerans]|uniref:Uncharacterized protein n=1 Tax=Microbulbifer thermotolerans TaxID=252514 RepID=A0A143HQ91_MICTH|nr:hypothetical protein A3224_14280 [Microbulbifer thermotolerans]
MAVFIERIVDTVVLLVKLEGLLGKGEPVLGFDIRRQGFEGHKSQWNISGATLPDHKGTCVQRKDISGEFLADTGSAGACARSPAFRFFSLM